MVHVHTARKHGPWTREFVPSLTRTNEVFVLVREKWAHSSPSYAHINLIKKKAERSLAIDGV